MKTQLTKKQVPTSHRETVRALTLRRFNHGACSLVAAAATSLFLQTATRAANPLPFYESFPTTYGDNENLGLTNSSGVKWDFGNSIGSSCSRIATAGAQSYPGLVCEDPAASRGQRSNPGGSGNKNRGVTLAVAPGTTLYASFLLNVQTTNTHTRPMLGFSTSSSGTGVNANGAVVHMDTENRLLIAKNSATPAPPTTYALTASNTYLVVLRYQYNTVSESDDEVALWLNPVSLGNANSIPTPTLTTTNNSDIAALASMAIFQMSPTALERPGLFYLDEIRVATNWADVTPPACSPGNVYNVTGGGSVCAGAGFPVGLSGSQTGVEYGLFKNGVFTGVSQPGTGAAVSFGNQTDSGLYTVLASNITTTCAGWMNNSVQVAVLAPPSIAAQPSAVTAVSGSSVTFTVSATGDALTYQWRRNGTNLTNGANISGATTPILTIYPISAADALGAANGYDVVVSGACTPAAFSTRVALSLKPQSNLIWAGDGISNPWDVGLSTTWLENGQPAVFRSGDKVTFDDTSINTLVTLADSFLSPALITVTGSRNYSFTTGGNIYGAGTSLLMTGTGTLFVTNVNSFAGGTTISNGQISINHNSSLGSGPITLAGGVLDVLNAQVVLANPINVLADSTINVHNTSTAALQLDNALGGTGGTLTIANATTATPTVRLSANSFTFNRPLLLNTNSGPGLVLAFYNASGDQTFSGEISGGGRLERTTGGGNTILNAQNTYSGGTLLRDGGLGLGASSISTPTSPPAVASGPLGSGTLTNDTASPANMELFAVGGARTVGNAITWLNSNAGPALVVTGTNDLTLSGPVDLAGNNRILQVDNTGTTILTGDIFNGSLTKTGNGVLEINGSPSSLDSIVINAGIFGGTGVFSGTVTIAAGATLSPGSSIGTLTIVNDLALQGNVLVEVNTSFAPASDLVSVNGVLNNTGTGTVTVNNLGPALAVGNKFTLFSKPMANGSALTVTGAGVTWANNLAVDGSISVASVSSPKPVITSTVISGGNFIFSGTNGTGTAGGSYYVLSSTDVGQPLANWTRESTNSFLSGGAFSVTNPVVPGVPIKFYLLQLP